MARLAYGVLGIVLAGVVVGVVAFEATGQYPRLGYLGPLCRSDDVRAAGFDPWTGEPVGDVYRCDPIGPGDPPSHLVTLPVPDDLVGRHAIPFPVGFAVGCVAATVFVLRPRHGRRTQSGDEEHPDVAPTAM